MTLVYVDTDSGTWGSAESIVEIDLSSEEQDFFDRLSDSERCAVAKIMASNIDQTDFDVYSAHAAYLSEHGTCSLHLDEVPDCNTPGPDCTEHQGRCD